MPAWDSGVSPRELFLHVLDKVENTSHDFVRRQKVVCVECVDDALFGMAERSVGGYPTQHEEAHVVRWMAINNLTCFVVVIKYLPHEVDVLGEGLARALPEHEVVQHGE
jgi:hypothetical protein